MIRVLVCDDHDLVRAGIRRLIEETSDIQIGAETRNARETIVALDEREFDVILLDLSLPDQGGMEVLVEARKKKPKTPVLIVTMHPEDQFAIRALKLGAAGYVTKESSPNLLLDAIRKLVAGGKYVSPEITERMLALLSEGEARSPHDRLSNREFQVLTMIASGQTVSQIAQKLDLSVKTVSTHRAHILEKMQMGSNSDLTHYVIKNNLI